jgi:hypothetical protein
MNLCRCDLLASFFTTWEPNTKFSSLLVPQTRISKKRIYFRTLVKLYSPTTRHRRLSKPQCKVVDGTFRKLLILKCSVHYQVNLT